MGKSAADHKPDFKETERQVIDPENLDLFELQRIASYYADDQISGGKFRELARNWLFNKDVDLTNINNEKEYVRNATYEVEQIFFSNWNNPKAPKNYFCDIDNIAYMIGAMLKDLSTIAISQTKEKFGEARVYVDIANFERVEGLWRAHGQSGEPTGDFINLCRISDMKHYHYIYRMITQLFPQYKKAIVSGADYIEWTFSTIKEWDDWCSYQEKYRSNVRDSYKDVYESLYAPLKDQSRP